MFLEIQPAHLLENVCKYLDFNSNYYLTLVNKYIVKEIRNYNSPISKMASHYYAERNLRIKLKKEKKLQKWVEINRKGYFWVGPIKSGIYWTTTLNKITKLSLNPSSKIVNVYYFGKRNKMFIKPLQFKSNKDAKLLIIRFAEIVWSREIRTYYNILNI